MSSYTLGAYRKNRDRDVDGCALDVKNLILKLRKIDPEVFRWKSRAMTKKMAASSPFINGDDADTIKWIVQKGANRRDDNKEVIKDLGFRVSFWNGRTNPNEAATLSVLNGVTNNSVYNNVVITLPNIKEIEKNNDVAKSILVSAVDTINAEWAVLYKSSRNEIDDIFLDRGLYISNSYNYPNIDKFRGEADAICETEKGKIFLKV